MPYFLKNFHKYPFRLFTAAVRENQQEFFAAPTRRRASARRNAVADDRRNLRQYSVAAGVSETIVHALEIVDVTHSNAVILARLGQLVHYPPSAAAIEQERKRVAFDKLAQIAAYLVGGARNNGYLVLASKRFLVKFRRKITL